MSLFPIIIKVEESQVGSVLKSLHRLPGVAEINIDFDQLGAKRPYTKNGDKPAKKGVVPKKAGRKERKPRSNTNRLIALKAVDDGPKSVADIRNSLSMHGQSPKSGNSLVAKMKEQGQLRGDGRGQVSITPEGRRLLKELTNA